MRARVAITGVMAVVGIVSVASAAPVPRAARKADPALEKVLALDVRSAPLANVIEEMAAAGEVRMRLGRSALPFTAAGAGDQRITLYADRASVGEFQRAVATLLRLRWTADQRPTTTSSDQRPTNADEGQPASRVVIKERNSSLIPHPSSHVYTLDEESSSRAAATALRQRQASRFLEGVWETAEQMASPATAAEYLQKRRAEFAREHPEYGTRTLESLDANFLRQSLLIAPLDEGWRGRLAQQRSLRLPIAWMNDFQAALMVSFVYGGAGNSGVTPSFAREGRGFDQPGAGVQYRLFYGDRWSDTLLRIQVGLPGDWQMATLPSILYRSEDGTALYPKSKVRPTDASVWRRLPPTFSVTGKSWDDALVRLARTMKIRVASDSYRRPALYRPEIEPPSLAGLTLIEALDRLCRAHGMFWWMEEDWYYFRSRTWVDEENVAVPDRFLRRWADGVRQNGRLSSDDLDLLGGLSEEQLMTLNLLAANRAAPAALTGATAATTPLDPDGAALASMSLVFLRSLAPVQRELALNGGLPALWLAPIQQQLFGAIAAELGFLPQPETIGTWGFAIDQRFARPATEKEPVRGVVSFQWALGPNVRRVAEVPITEGR